MLILTNSNGESKAYEYREVKKMFEENPDIRWIYGPLDGLGDNPSDWVEVAALPLCNGVWDEDEGDYVFCPDYWDTTQWYISVFREDVFRDERGDIRIQIGHNFTGQYHRDWGNNPVGYCTDYKTKRDKKRRNKFIRRRFRKNGFRSRIKDLMINSNI